LADLLDRSRFGLRFEKMMKDFKSHRTPANQGRRAVLAGFGAGAAFLGLDWISRAWASPPKETGLSFEGLLKGHPGFQPRMPMTLAAQGIPGFLSRQQLALNYSAYRAAFDDLLSAERELRRASNKQVNPREYATLRTRQVRAANSALMHEFYFRNVAASPGPPSRYILANMTEHMGTMADWREDFLECARAARTWAALVYDPYDDRWHNTATGEEDAGGWVGANPLIVCDVAEHAWSPEYANREEYVSHFIDHIAWNEVASRYRAVDRH
jgi:superoxide dismutase